MTDRPVPNDAVSRLDRVLTIQLARVTEAAAVAASKWTGRGAKTAADQAAVDAMRKALNGLDIQGTVVIGEGERDEAPMLYIGEQVGTGEGPKADIALDPLEGTTLCAKDMPGSLAVIALAEGGALLNAPDVYMEKIAVGPGLPPGLARLDADPGEIVKEIAKAKGVTPREIGACVLDRPRHHGIIEKIQNTGARVRLINDGDIAGVIHTTEPATGIDLYMGIGGAPEGVLAAAALRCVGGQMQGRLVFRNEAEKARAQRLGLTDLDRVYDLNDLASGDVMFAATGVTDGNLVPGVKKVGPYVETHTLVMRSRTGTVRWIRAHHVADRKFA